MNPLLAASSEHPSVHLTAQTRILAAIIAVAFMVMILELIRRDDGKAHADGATRPDRGRRRDADQRVDLL